MERYDIDTINTILKQEFRGFFIPEDCAVSDARLIYKGVIKEGDSNRLNLLQQRFHELGYDVKTFGGEDNLLLVFQYQDQRPSEEVVVKRKYTMHIILFLITFFTTSWAWVYFSQEANIFAEPSKIWLGLPFSIPLMTILLAHEMGHYIMSKRHNVESTLPYFIPFPNIIGTMGAVIKMKSQIPDREALIDIGMAGPLAGIVVTIPIMFIGLMMSNLTISIYSEATGGIFLGESIIFVVFSWILYGRLPPNLHISLHPIAFAGWIGLLVTFMNLFPVSQLDGGHISYALFGRRHKVLGKITCIALLLMSIFYWPWFIWMVFVLFIGLGHPPPIDDSGVISKKKRVLGYICLAIFLLTFVPRPFYGPDLPVDLLTVIKMFR